MRVENETKRRYKEIHIQHIKHDTTLDHTENPLRVKAKIEIKYNHQTNNTSAAKCVRIKVKTKKTKMIQRNTHISKLMLEFRWIMQRTH